MARKHENPASEALEELESFGDRMAEWVGRNPMLVLGTALGVLIIAAAYGFSQSYVDSERDRASAELAAVGAQFRKAMGASPNDFEIVEPANPETAHKARSEALEAYLALAEEYSGSAVGSIAALEAGGLQADLGDPERALAIWRDAAGHSESIPRALLLNRIAAAHEDAGDWAEAAAAYQEAFEVESYPLRYGALLDAARCLAESGDAPGAVALFERVENEAENLRVPDHIALRMRELRAASIAQTGS
ncbi:MAG: tetratricopeptide repeat protein [Myxococcota bacterium]